MKESKLIRHTTTIERKYKTKIGRSIILNTIQFDSATSLILPSSPDRLLRNMKEIQQSTYDTMASADPSLTTVTSEPPSERPVVPRSKSQREIAHDEKHSDYGNVVRDVIIGFADGLTVPFALTAGLSS